DRRLPPPPVFPESSRRALSAPRSPPRAGVQWRRVAGIPRCWRRRRRIRSPLAPCRGGERRAGAACWRPWRRAASRSKAALAARSWRRPAPGSRNTARPAPQAGHRRVSANGPPRAKRKTSRHQDRPSLTEKCEIRGNAALGLDRCFPRNACGEGPATLFFVEGFLGLSPLCEVRTMMAFNEASELKAAAFGRQLSLSAFAERERKVRRDFWAKLKRFAGMVPFVDDLVAAYYCALDPATPMRVRGMLLAAIAY